LNSAGLQPDIIIARAAVHLDKKRKEKIAFNCNISEKEVISAPDVESIYEIPINFEKDGLSRIIFEKLKIRPRKSDLKDWEKLVRAIKRLDLRTKRGLASSAQNNKHPRYGAVVKIGIVGKYFGTGNFILADSYISVIEAVKHAAYYFNRKPEIHWINSEEFEASAEKLKQLSEYDGIIIPGGFGSRGVEGKISAIRYLREKKIPFLGLCYGMQLAVIEFSRSVAGMKKANTTEINPETPHPVIDIMPEQKKNLSEKNFGATMRLGAYPAILKKGTIAYKSYRTYRSYKTYKPYMIYERHRHRYEVNPRYVEILEKKGLIFSGFSPDRRLMEIMELPKNKHPFFVATQFHPEFKSRPLKPHPLFREFIKIAIKK